MSDQTHWGAGLMHGGPTQHEGPADQCSAPDCLDANWPPRDQRGRFVAVDSCPSEPDQHETRHRAYGTWPCPWNGSPDCPVLHVLTGCCEAVSDEDSR